MKPRAYYRPSTLEKAFALKEAEGDARFIAGGTDLMVGDRLPRALISLRAIPGLEGIEEVEGIESGGQTRIGALTLVGDLAAHPMIIERYPVLVEACRCFGSMQIRNAATVGGNLCNASPAADLAPPLLVLGTRVKVRGPGGAREIPLKEFFLGPGRTALEHDEIVTDVVVGDPAPALFLRRSRVRMDIALLSVAVRLDLSGGRCTRARIAAGAAAPTPLRLREAEALLEGETVTPELAARAGKAAAAAVRPIDDIRTTAAYRRRLVEVYVRRAVESLVSLHHSRQRGRDGRGSSACQPGSAERSDPCPPVVFLAEHGSPRSRNEEEAGSEESLRRRETQRSVNWAGQNPRGRE